MSLGDLKNEMKITVNGKNYTIEFFLGATVRGLRPSNQEHACIWCKCPRGDTWDTSKKWSIIDAEAGARSLEKITEHTRSKQFNCKNPPLFPFISFGPCNN